MPFRPRTKEAEIFLNFRYSFAPKTVCPMCVLQCYDSVASRTVLAVIIIQNNCDQRKFVRTITL